QHYIPVYERENFIKDLGLAEHFRARYNVLLVAYKLNQLGYSPSYQPVLENGRTPDWFASSPDGLQFIVEVFTPQRSSEIIKIENLWGDLSAHIKNMNLGYGISIRVDTEYLPPDSRQTKSLAKAVKEWLESS